MKPSVPPATSSFVSAARARMVQPSDRDEAMDKPSSNSHILTIESYPEVNISFAEARTKTVRTASVCPCKTSIVYRPIKVLLLNSLSTKRSFHDLSSESPLGTTGAD
uniref:Uncharacterized protein n=1 Tax=Cucumis sativus TaxID=3659 RepID=A0A0A0KX07_CUCSA